MKQRELVSEIARRMPFTTRSQVEEVIEVQTELWAEELTSGSEVIIPDIGRLSLEVQRMKRGGVMHKRGTSSRLYRVYGRFRPAPILRGQTRGDVHDQT